METGTNALLQQIEYLQYQLNIPSNEINYATQMIKNDFNTQLLYQEKLENVFFIQQKYVADEVEIDKCKKQLAFIVDNNIQEQHLQIMILIQQIKNSFSDQITLTIQLRELIRVPIDCSTIKFENINFFQHLQKQSFINIERLCKIFIMTGFIEMEHFDLLKTLNDLNCIRLNEQLTVQFLFPDNQCVFCNEYLKQFTQLPQCQNSILFQFQQFSTNAINTNQIKMNDQIIDVQQTYTHLQIKEFYYNENILRKQYYEQKSICKKQNTEICLIQLAKNQHNKGGQKFEVIQQADKQKILQPTVIKSLQETTFADSLTLSDNIMNNFNMTDNQTIIQDQDENQQDFFDFLQNNITQSKYTQNTNDVLFIHQEPVQTINIEEVNEASQQPILNQLRISNKNIPVTQYSVPFPQTIISEHHLNLQTQTQPIKMISGLPELNIHVKKIIKMYDQQNENKFEINDQVKLNIMEEQQKQIIPTNQIIGSEKILEDSQVQTEVFVKKRKCC